jgi:hypothetical protein
MFKYLASNHTWFELFPGMKTIAGSGSVKSAVPGKPGAIPRRVENILLAPYSFREGDLVCAFEVPPASVPKKPVVVCRPEDLYLREQIKLKKLAKRNCAGAGHAGDTANKKRKPASEVPLSLGDNFNFSDDEDSS